jgi:carboxyl-terminal processing protease
VKNRLPLVLGALLTVSLLLQMLVVAQKIETPNPLSNRQNNARRITRERATSADTAKIERDFADALTMVQENYVDGNKLDYNGLFKSSILGMLKSLDPHSNFYDREEFETLRTEQRSEYSGIGASIGERRLGDNVDTYILATFEESPAARAGLRFGDRIVEVDGQPMRGKSSGEVRDKIRGPRGKIVKLKIERASNNKIEDIEIVRDSVGQPSIPDAYMIKPGVGYVAMIGGFNYTTADELQSILEQMRSKGMTSLILDLRNNPGGFLDQAIKVADKFLQKGQVILTQKGRMGGTDKTYTSDNTSPDATPLVILINRNTASASEIVAGAMQDHDRALIVGETSFGKGLVQSIIHLPYDAGLTLTSAKYFTPSGRLIQRDYSNGSLYDYMTRGGFSRQEEEETAAAKPTGPESHTDSGRLVYGGGGITPDEVVKSRTQSAFQRDVLINPIFFFARDLVNGRIAGFDNYKFQRAIEYGHDLTATDFPMTDALFKAFKEYVVSKSEFKITAVQLERNRDYIQRQLRYDIASAAYGSVKASQVINMDDPQIAKAIEVLPRARELAINAVRGRNPPQKSFE